MKIRFCHQNFPGQFRHLARHYANGRDTEVFALGENKRIGANIARGAAPGLNVGGYTFNADVDASLPEHLRFTSTNIQRGKVVAKALLELKKKGFTPDVIYGHPGWGETLFLRDVYPTAKIAEYCEFFFKSEGQDFQFDPAFSDSGDDGLQVRTQNMTQLVSLTAADIGISPTSWQRAQYPAMVRGNVAVVHDGIDTERLRPDREATVAVDGGKRVLSRDDEVITYVARNLEPYRGFHMFMRALPEILARRPKAHVIVVGGDNVSYSRRLQGTTYRAWMMKEVGDRLDRSRVHFTGRVPYDEYVKILKVSSTHVYLTYPFVLSWSMLEAMVAARAKTDAVRAQGLPTVSLTSQYSNNKQPVSVGLGTQQYPATGNSWYVGVQVKIPIFEGFSRTYQVREAQAQEEVRQAALFKATQQVSLEVWSSYQQLLTGTRILTDTASLLAAATRSVQAAQRRYAMGAGSILELLAAQNALAEAKKQRNDALADWRNERLQLASKLGDLTRVDLRAQTPVQ